MNHLKNHLISSPRCESSIFQIFNPEQYRFSVSGFLHLSNFYFKCSSSHENEIKLYLNGLGLKCHFTDSYSLGWAVLLSRNLRPHLFLFRVRLMTNLSRKWNTLIMLPEALFPESFVLRISFTVWLFFIYFTRLGRTKDLYPWFMVRDELVVSCLVIWKWEPVGDLWQRSNSVI
jgi:hypothetical protein